MKTQPKDPVEGDKMENICFSCINEDFYNFRNIKSRSTNLPCSYCSNSQNVTLSLDALSENIENAIKIHYIKIESIDDSEAAIGTTDLATTISELLPNTSHKPIADLVKLIKERSKFSSSEKFITINHEFDISEAKEKWDLAVASVASGSGEEEFLIPILERYITHINRFETKFDRKSLIIAGHGYKTAMYYRARSFPSLEYVMKDLLHIEKNLGPAPAKNATAGRMNLRGEGLFYGSFKKDVAIREVRPARGEYVLLASFKFQISATAKFLDIDAIKTGTPSKLDPEYLELMTEQAFFVFFVDEIVKRTEPGQEIKVYETTQKIAKYLSTIINPEINGIIFKSSQSTHDAERMGYAWADSGYEEYDDYNVVFFHKSSAIYGANVTRVDGAIHTKLKGVPGTSILLLTYLDSPPPDPTQLEGDERTPLLEIDFDSVELYKILDTPYEYEQIDLRHVSINPRSHELSFLTEKELRKLGMQYE